jgi:uncharacterized protein (TIGR00369 family)
MSYTVGLKPQMMTVKELNALLRKMPFNYLMGFRVTRRHKDGLSMECAVRPELMNGRGSVHGGVTASIVDTVFGFSIFGCLGHRDITTVEMKINYLSPATHGKLRARARFIRTGRRLVVGSVDVTDTHSHPIATALVTYMLL